MGFWGRLQASLKQQSPLHIASNKRASVAAVFRHSSDAKLQLLFIRRCVNPRDTWSGQIAFPGGRTQAHETDIDSARRETMEEIGLNLHDPSIQVLGQVSDRPVHYGTTVVSTFVFYTPSTEFTPQLEPSEVQDALWVDVDYLLHAPIKALKIPVIMIFPWLKSYPSLHKLLQSHSYLSHFHFPCIYLPRPNTSITSEQDTRRKSNDFVLWGLTYTMMSDLLVSGGHSPLPLASPSLRFVRHVLFHLRSH
ncbi:hypothetical protein THRCLA_00790 [Thraustotheca clavata]|uniref:Nudix hydrolase domain-containing protein n=1 Tax=Thraustotheca clavata TaxID=74557 RepID=A0A1W0AA64_9STRA|nr:hypothetical protein THRCLA_00790 [Thraustotheca clavata]